LNVAPHFLSATISMGRRTKSAAAGEIRTVGVVHGLMDRIHSWPPAIRMSSRAAAMSLKGGLPLVVVKKLEHVERVQDSDRMISSHSIF